MANGLLDKQPGTGIHIGADDEALILSILNRGLHDKALPRWTVLRLALAYSLQLGSEPDAALDTPENPSTGSEYELEGATSSRLENHGWGELSDLGDATRALLSVYHGEDLFADHDRYRNLLQRHVRRGLREIGRGWREGQDFYQFLRRELLGGLGHPAKNADRSEDIRLALQEIGVRGEIQGHVAGPRLTRYNLHLPQDGHFDLLRRGLRKLSFLLGPGARGVMMGSTENPNIVALDVPRQPETWSQIPYGTMRRWIAAAPAEAELPVWPGTDVLGNPVVFDLAAAPHLLVGGAPGSGKSGCLHALILSLILRISPTDLSLLLIDPKQVELTAYRDLPHLEEPVVTEVNHAVAVLEGVVEEMEERTSRMAMLGVRNLTEAHQGGRLNSPYMAVFVNDLADLFARSRAAESALFRLAQKGHAAGIHLVLASRRADAETLSAQLRCYIPSRIALTVREPAESEILIEEAGAEHLSGRGDMLLRIGDEPTRRVHGVRIIPDDVAAAVREAGRILS